MTQDHEAAHGERRRSSSPQGYPEDRFDTPQTRRVGAHRVTANLRVNRRFVLGGLVGAALLTTIGIVGVTIANSIGTLPDLPSESQGPAPEKVKPALDPDASVAILDGTSASGDLAMRLADIVTDKKWGQIALAGPASVDDAKISAVFYADPANEAAALGLAKELGGVSAYQSDNYHSYDARLVVLLGTDYAGPGRN